MAELFVETTAVHITGFPQFLREIWDHLYPGAPPPTYRVYHNRLDRSTSEFTATVHLRPEPATAGSSHALTSSVTTQATRAVQEAAGDAILFLRTFDPVMRRCTRYAYFPRLDLDRGDILFPNPGDSSSPSQPYFSTPPFSTSTSTSLFSSLPHFVPTWPWLR